MNVYEILKALDINYEEIEHRAVYTIEEALKENIPDRIKGVECKNLFVKGKKKFYLIFLEASKRANLKQLALIVGEPKLSFASEVDLQQILGLEVGSVTPLGIINDVNNEVTLLLDKSLKSSIVLVHPNVNTKTLAIKFDDLLKIMDYTNHTYEFI